MVDLPENMEVALPKPKKAVYIRLDREVIAFFKEQGRGYQTKINAVLKAYMRAKQKEKENETD